MHAVLLAVFFIRCSISALLGAIISMPFCLYVCLNFCVDNDEYDSFTDGLSNSSIERTIYYLAWCLSRKA